MQLIPGEVDATDALGFAGEDSLGDRRWAEVCAVDLHESAPSVFLDGCRAGVIAWRGDCGGGGGGGGGQTVPLVVEWSVAMPAWHL